MLLGSPQHSQHSNGPGEGAAGTCSCPPASFFQDPQGCHTLLPRSHLLGERRRRSSPEPKAGESRGAGRKQWERQFSLIWANPLPAEQSQNLTRKKNNSFPASRQLGAGFPQPTPHRHRETQAASRVLWGCKAGRSGTCCVGKIHLLRLAGDPAAPQTQHPPHHCSCSSISAQRPQMGHGRARALAGQGESQTTHPHTSRAPRWPRCHPMESGGLLSPQTTRVVTQGRLRMARQEALAGQHSPHANPLPMARRSSHFPPVPRHPDSFLFPQTCLPD